MRCYFSILILILASLLVVRTSPQTEEDPLNQDSGEVETFDYYVEASSYEPTLYHIFATFFLPPKDPRASFPSW